MSNNPRPAELLRRYRRNVYPPSLSEDQQAVVRTYLEGRGLEPRVGAIAIDPSLSTQSLVGEAMKELGLLKGISAEDTVVGPNSSGMPDGISIWVPAKRDMP